MYGTKEQGRRGTCNRGHVTENKGHVTGDRYEEKLLGSSICSEDMSSAREPGSPESNARGPGQIESRHLMAAIGRDQLDCIRRECRDDTTRHDTTRQDKTRVDVNLNYTKLK